MTEFHLHELLGEGAIGDRKAVSLSEPFVGETAPEPGYLAAQEDCSSGQAERSPTDAPLL